jgi:DNA-directed RNA polymerase subunit RPC12/RpoP
MFKDEKNNEMTMENKIITCIQCEKEFEFTIHDQLRYEKMNFDEPRRCPDCRKNKLRTTDSQNIKRNRKKMFYGSQFED